MKPHKYILDGKKPVPCDDIMEWAHWLNDAEKRRVAITTLPGLRISTMFLGIDHNFFDVGPPLLFETMIFTEDDSEVVDRYSTWEEAEAGHALAVTRLQAG